MRKGIYGVMAFLVLAALPCAAKADVPAGEGVLGDWGLSLAVGGGVGGFTGQAMRDMTGTAGLWDARLSAGIHKIVGVEVGYLGGAQSIDSLGLDTNAVLLSTALDADLRLQPVRLGYFLPYAFAGAGWHRYDVTNANTNTSDVQNSDNAFEVPMGLGVAMTVQRFELDLRGTFRASVADQGLTPNAAGGNPALHSWNVLLRAGYLF